MPPKRVPLTITIIATAVAWLAWILVIARTDPTTAGALGFGLFYLTLFAAVSGSATIVGLAARRRAADCHQAINIAIRQGALTGLAVVIAVFLQSRNLLTWLNLLFLIVALTLLELFIVSLRITNRDTNQTNVSNATNSYDS